MKKISLIFLVGLFFFACDSGNLVDFPLLKTNDLLENTPEKVVFQGEFVDLGVERIIEFGITINSQSGFDIGDNRYLADSVASVGVFEVAVDGGFRLNDNYYYRAFVITENNTVFGNEMSFVGQGSLPPEIISFSPTEIKSGEVLEVVAKNFSKEKDLNSIKIGSFESNIPCDSIIGNSLFFTIPEVSFGSNSTIQLFSDIYSCISEGILTIEGDWELIFDDMNELMYSGIAFMFDDKYFAGLGPEVGWNYYDLNSKDWHTLSNFPADNYDFEYVIVDNRIFVFAFNYNIDGSSIDLWEYKYVEDSWEYKSQFPGYYRFQSAIFKSGNNIIVGPGQMFGEMIEIETPYDVWQYNIETNLWMQLNNFPYSLNAPLWNVFTFYLSDYNYIAIYGEEPLSIYKYEPLVDNWDLIITLNDFFMTTAFGFVLDEVLYIGKGESDDLFQFDIDTGIKSKVSKLPINIYDEQVIKAFSYLNEGYILVRPGYYSEFPFYKLIKYIK